MKDYLHNILKWIDHNRGQVIGVMIPVIFCAVVLAGCLESETGSVLKPGEKVTRPEYTAEIVVIEKNLELKRLEAEQVISAYNIVAESLQGQIIAGFDDLDEQDLRTAELFETIGGFATTAIETGIKPLGIAQILMMLASIGWGIGNFTDNIRKDREIKIRDIEIKNLPGP